MADHRKPPVSNPARARGSEFMSYTIYKDFTFEAAHQLDPAKLGAWHKCCRLHGHSYRVRVYCTSDTLDQRNFVVDYADISAAVDPIIAAKCDHYFLNDTMPFHTTAENLAEWFYNVLKPVLSSVSRVDVYETAKTCVTYTP